LRKLTVDERVFDRRSARNCRRLARFVNLRLPPIFQRGKEDDRQGTGSGVFFVACVEC
jgi:hypothetical protein